MWYYRGPSGRACGVMARDWMCSCVLDDYSTALKKCDGAQYSSSLSSSETDNERSKRHARCRVVQTDEEFATVQDSFKGKKISSRTKTVSGPAPPPSLLKNAIITPGTLKLVILAAKRGSSHDIRTVAVVPAVVVLYYPVKVNEYQLQPRS